MRSTPGNVVAPGGLRSARARELGAYVSSPRADFVELVCCKSDEGRDIVVLELDLSIPQRPKVAIALRETIAVYFQVDGETDSQPHFVPLREEFPDGVVHLMAGDHRTPPSLCIWDAPFAELRATLTPAELVRQLRLWLERMSQGTLHEADQPIEPVMQGGAGIVIVPPDPKAHDGLIVQVAAAGEWKDVGLTLRFCASDKPSEDGDNQNFILCAFETPRRSQRAVERTPLSLADLRDVLAAIGFDLIAHLRAWLRSYAGKTDALRARPVLLVCVPKVATDDPDEIPVNEYWAFCLGRTVEQLGVEIGSFDKTSHGVGVILEPPERPDVSTIALDTMIVVPEIEGKDLPALAGLSSEIAGEPNDPRFGLIGAGAIGSALLERAARCGFGKWVIIDDDTFLPHNAVRHVLGDWAIGRPKAQSLARFVNALVPGIPVLRSVHADVLTAAHKEDVVSELDAVDAVIDASASVPVSRWLASRTGAHRNISVFLNPAGKDLVILAEAGDRQIDLWDLEAAYYRAVVCDPILLDHLQADGARRRYGNGCRDRTAAISGDAVGLLGSIAMRQIMRCIRETRASADIWKYNDASGEVRAIPIAISPSVKLELGGWRVYWPQDLISRLRSRRLNKLPNETGGVLIGLADREHRRIVVTDEIAAPPDSQEGPLCFVRGRLGVDREVERLSEASVGQLRYLGEWHSHPHGAPASPSPTDDKLFADLADMFADSAEPFLMAILSDDRLYSKLGLDRLADEELLLLDHQEASFGGEASGR